ncbi:4Fe-4S dicluster domain-containing protein [Desulfoferula mesophila]
MPKRLYVDFHRCTGCGLCVDVCSLRNAGIASPDNSNVLIHRDEAAGIFQPLVCLQCDAHPCVEACPQEAIQLDSAMAIYKVDPKLCIACGICQDECIYLGIKVGDAVARKCDLCSGEPICASVCLPGAIQFRDSDLTEMNAAFGKRAAEIKGMRKQADD